MLVLPMQHTQSPHSNGDDTFSPAQRGHREESPQTFELRKQIASAMLSITPSTKPPTPKRPKLSLQTASLPSPSAQGAGNTRNQATSSALSLNSESPTTRNTKVNRKTFEAPLPTSSASINPPVSVELPSTLPISQPSTPPASSLLGRASPFQSHDQAPYNLPLGAHSILRNSPLPKRHLSAISSRGAAKRMFPPVKNVVFSDNLAEMMPTPVFDASSGEEAEKEVRRGTESDERHRERRATIEAEDGHASRGGRRTKRRREWVWRPVDEGEDIGVIGSVDIEGKFGEKSQNVDT